MDPTKKTFEFKNWAMPAESNSGFATEMYEILHWMQYILLFTDLHVAEPTFDRELVITALQKELLPHLEFIFEESTKPQHMTSVLSRNVLPSILISAAVHLHMYLKFGYKDMLGDFFTNWVKNQRLAKDMLAVVASFMDEKSFQDALQEEKEKKERPHMAYLFDLIQEEDKEKKRAKKRRERKSK